jgi:Xaa-Pro dipeptidase
MAETAAAPPERYRGRLDRLRRRLGDDGLAGLLVSQPDSIYYLTGFFHYPSERPILLWVPLEGEPTLVVPHLEAEHAAPRVSDLVTYEEFPGRPDAWQSALDALVRRGLGRGITGFEGALAASAHARLKAKTKSLREAGGHVMALRMAKDPEEIALLEKAGRYSDLMVAEGMRFIVERGPGVREAEVAAHVSAFVTAQIAEHEDELVFVESLGGGLVCFGDHTALPHALPGLRRLGDARVVLLSLGCMVGGYAAESERTFFLASPTAEEVAVHEAVQEAQEEGFRHLRAGVACEEADAAARRVLERLGFGAYIRHRLGHGMGLRFHEPPWVAPGDRTPLPVGATVSCEPGLYLPGRFGVRIADTVLVTADGPRRLTRHPRGYAPPA